MFNCKWDCKDDKLYYSYKQEDEFKDDELLQPQKL